MRANAVGAGEVVNQRRYLGGAPGRALALPTWLLLPFNADWRWQLDRTDSPWYPSLRLFRQSSLGDWRPVVTELAAMLGGISATPAKDARDATAD